GGVAQAAAAVAVVARCGDDEGAGRDRLADGEVDREVARVGAEAEIDDAPSGARRREDAPRELARLELRAVALGGVPRAEDGARVDPHDPDAVRRRRDDGRD